VKVIDGCKEIEHFAFKGKYLNDIFDRTNQQP
jgi:hypothetical protein